MVSSSDQILCFARVQTMEILGAIQTDFGKIQMASWKVFFPTFNVNYVNKTIPVNHVNAFPNKVCILKLCLY